MTYNKFDIKYLAVFMLMTIFGSCKRQNEFLSVIPSVSLSVPNTLDNLQLLLQNDNIFNNADPLLGIASCDDYYIPYSTYIAATSIEMNVYNWQNNPYPNQDVADWTNCYSQVFYANTVLDNLSRIAVSQEDQNRANQIKGSALFFRAKAYYNLMQIFTLPYDSTKANVILGVPLKLNADLDIVNKRSTLAECYTQVINDLTTAVSLLPLSSNVITSPNRFAAEGYLARVYLTMGNYTLGYQSANAALLINDSLSDFNTFIYPTAHYLTAKSQYPLREDGFHSCTASYSIISFTKEIVDSMLYKSYDSNDLRKQAFFEIYSGSLRFKGSYEFDHSAGQYFDGIAVDELYLVRAECNARSGNIIAALNDLNTLLSKRYMIGTFVPIVGLDQLGTLKEILTERRKELLFRGLRWIDLRRLNSDTRFATTLFRNLNGIPYSLPPGDLRYALLIPDTEISLSNIQQNARQ